jgi:hypothetical protein
MDKENLGPAERILQTVLTYADHLYHGRPGIVSTNHSAVGVLWEPVTHKVENGQKVVYKLVKAGKKTNRVRAGVLRDDNKIVGPTGGIVGEYREAGLFVEVASWMYRQIADVWKLDNEFAAKWATYAFAEDHKDLKTILAAFMLVQTRKGDPVVDDGKIAFYDADYRDVGEAMMLIYNKGGKDKDLEPKLLVRMHDLLRLPEISKINHELGFGQSARKPFVGRWTKAVEKWLQYREQNPKLLEGLVKSGWRRTVMDLVRRVGYRPESPKFFEILRWKQKQSDDGRRQIAIGVNIAPADNWENLTETQICEKIVRERIGLKRVEGLLPKSIGLTRAIMAVIIESDLLSDKDLIIRTPTIEDLGLDKVPSIKAKWERAAVANATNTRGAHIARNVTSKELKEKLEEGADNALKKEVEKEIKGISIDVVVDISGSMNMSLIKAKEYLSKFVQGIPLDKIKAVVFNMTAKRVELRVASKAGVDNAFVGYAAGGGTNHACAIRRLAQIKHNEEDDLIIVFVGDEGENGNFAAEVNASGLKPMAFGLIKVPGQNGSIVTDTAAALGIPCFNIDEKTFDDVYAIPRIIRNLISATPVRTTARASSFSFVRETLVDKIIKTELLAKPKWA